MPLEFRASAREPNVTSQPSLPPNKQDTTASLLRGEGSIAHLSEIATFPGISAALPAATGRQSRFSFAREHADTEAAVGASTAEHGVELVDLDHRSMASQELANRPLTAPRKPPPGFEDGGGRQANREAAIEGKNAPIGSAHSASALPSRDINGRQQSGVVLLRHLRGATRAQPDASLAAAVQAASTALTGVFSDPAIVSAIPDRRAPPPGFATGIHSFPKAGVIGAQVGGLWNAEVTASDAAKASVPRTIPAHSSGKSGGNIAPSGSIAASPRSSRGGRKKRGGKGRGATTATAA